jgi:hypothetical protein
VVDLGRGPVFLRTLSVELGPSDHLAIRYAIVGAIYVASLAIFGGWRIDREDWPRLLAIISHRHDRLQSRFRLRLRMSPPGSAASSSAPSRC